MYYTCDSEVSDDTRELIEQRLASARRRRVTIAPQSDNVRHRASVHDMDISSVQHPSSSHASNGDGSTHGLTPTCRELVGGQSHNTSYFLIFFS